MPAPCKIFAILLVSLAITFFHRDLFTWVRFAADSSLYSYTLVIPPLCLMLMARREWISFWLIIIAFIALLTVFIPESETTIAPNHLHLFLLIAFGQLAALLYAGWSRFKQHVFPRLLFFAAIPLPPGFEVSLNHFLQSGSASLAHAMLHLLGLPVFRDGLNLALPGLTMEVAASCSGIRSTLVLLLVAAVAGYLLLKSPWQRALLIAVIIPLGMLRNALRIATIGWLTVSVDPAVISGPLHQHGGPLFFIVTLFPLFLLVMALRQCKGVS